MTPQHNTDSAAPSLPVVETHEKREPELAPPTLVIMRLVHAVVAQRLRFRALYEVLQEGEFEHTAYLERLHHIRERDTQALVAQLMYEDRDFTNVFGDWKKTDSDRYTSELKRVSKRKRAAPRKKQ